MGWPLFYVLCRLSSFLCLLISAFCLLFSIVLSCRSKYHKKPSLSQRANIELMVVRGELPEEDAPRIARQIMRENALELFPQLKERLWR